MSWRRMGSGCIDPHFLDLGISWRWVVSFTSRPLYSREKNPRYPLDRRFGGPQRRSGRREEDKILDTNGIRTPTALFVQFVASHLECSLFPLPSLSSSIYSSFPYSALFCYSCVSSTSPSSCYPPSKGDQRAATLLPRRQNRPEEEKKGTTEMRVGMEPQ
jgi:hypothetical protein